MTKKKKSPPSKKTQDHSIKKVAWIVRRHLGRFHCTLNYQLPASAGSVRAAAGQGPANHLGCLLCILQLPSPSYSQPSESHSVHLQNKKQKGGFL